MESRKRRNIGQAGTSSTANFDIQRFRSRDHEHRYNNVIKKRPVMRERGFELKEGEHPEIHRVIQGSKWGLLCTTPPPGQNELIQEFYANAFQAKGEERSFKSWVKGCEIDYSPHAINNYYGAKIVNDSYQCAFQKSMQERRLQAVVARLCMPGTDWILDKKGIPKHLLKADFKQVLRAWCTFVQSKLLPSMHKSEVTVHRAVLVDCIISYQDSRDEIDIGTLIARGIQEMAHEPKGVLAYASRITKLCLRAGVRMEGDNITMPEKPINASTLHEYLGLYQKRQREREQQESTQLPSPIQASSSQAHDALSIDKRLTRLEKGQESIMRGQAFISRSQKFIMRSQGGLARMMRNLATQLHLDTDSLGGMLTTEEDILSSDDSDREEEEVGNAQEADDETNDNYSNDGDT